MNHSSKDLFAAPTYIVLNVPSPVADEIRQMRRFFDIDRSHLSIEISLAGSNGLGTIAPNQDPEFVFREIDRIAGLNKPFKAEFGNVEKFPETGIFYYTVINPEPFIDLHNQLIDSAILFNRNPHPYKPHCTLRLAATTEFPEEDIIRRIQPPAEEFMLNTMSVCSLEGPMQEPRLLHRVNLI
ncbi:2'-5' RNA ligase family protein [Lentisphaerota bacterium ZTH]|nr:2'-5' RNA ligase family protein [Lentisphaerota bacterium]WET05458.1 2'-5' RNA ligase family protein [Lentisphaerota bacterium ZTH]